MTRDLRASPTVLVVDDIDDARFVLRRMLEMWDIRVLEAADGAEAVEVVRLECPDLILMDLNMPEVGGLAAVERLHALRDGHENHLRHLRHPGGGLRGRGTDTS